MSVVVIAGSGRHVGKTAVGCALVQALTEFDWTAVKVSPHDHGVSDPVWEEMDPDSEKDTGRYLAAGARRAFLVDGNECWEEAMSWLRKAGDGDRRGLLVESNRVEAALVTSAGQRGTCLAVLSGPPATWKASLALRATTADALVLTKGFCCDELPVELRRKRIFQLVPGQWSSAELVRFVRDGLT